MASQQFAAFCSKYGIDCNMYDKAAQIPRFIRVKPGNKQDEIIASIKQQVPSIDIALVPYIPQKYGFYSIPQNVNINDLTCYKNAQIYGLDVSSALAVLALHPQEGNAILDLCCAPGTKLCFLADMLHDAPKFYLTGVDVHLGRLAICKNVLKKYKIVNTRLIAANGTEFAIVEPDMVPKRMKNGRATKQMIKNMAKKQQTSDENLASVYDTAAGVMFYETRGVFIEDAIEKQKGAPPHKKQRIDEQGHAGQVQINELYDKILVDAECSTDGSVKHILKVGWAEFESKFLNETRIEQICKLQQNLIANAFKLLKPNGVLVYSTCSFMKEQNENVVQWLLEKEKDVAQLVDAFDDWPLEEKKSFDDVCKQGYLEKTIRLDPSINMSGLFIAKIRKVATKPTSTTTTTTN